MKRNKLFFILALFAVSMNLRPAITSVSPLLQDIQRDLEMSGLTSSFLTALPVLCMGAFAPIAAGFERRWGMKHAVAGCLVLIGFATAGRLLAVHTMLLLLTAVLIGIGIAVAGPLLSGFIKQYFPGHASVMVGVYTVGMGAGASLGAGFAVPLQHAYGSWNKSLAVWALLAFAALVAWLLIVPRPGHREERVGAASRGGLPWKVPRAWLITLFFGLQSALFYAVTAWLAPYLQSIGFSAEQAGITMTGFSLLQMVFCFLIPILAGNGSRRPWLLASGALALAGFLILTWLPELNIWVSVTLLSAGLGGLFPLGLLLPLDETDTPADASAWTAMATGAGYVIGSAGPIIVGLLLDASESFPIAFLSVIVMCVSLIICSLWLGASNTTG